MPDRVVPGHRPRRRTVIQPIPLILKRLRLRVPKKSVPGSTGAQDAIVFRGPEQSGVALVQRRHVNVRDGEAAEDEPSIDQPERR
jgi:hypothetical protein